MESLANIEIQNNYLLIKPDKDFEKLKMGLLIGTIPMTEARHYSVTGTVLIAPKRLIYRGEQIKKLRAKTGGRFGDDDIKELKNIVVGSMEYKTDLELQPGDKVWFDYLAHINANTEMKTMDIAGHGECFFIDYSRCFIREREGERIPINGYIWIKQVYRNSRDLGSGLIEPETVDNRVPGHAVVVKTGKPIQEYLSALHSDFPDTEIKEGDLIAFAENAATPLEYTLHETDGLQKLFKIKRKDIHGVIPINHFNSITNPVVSIDKSKKAFIDSAGNLTL